MNQFGYNNRNVVVSGCYSGIGKATALLLQEHGAIVHGIDLKKPEYEIDSFIQADFRELASIDRALDNFDVSGIYGLFNCAGVAPSRAEEDILMVNFFAARHITERVVQKMVKGSAIVSIGSIGGIGWRQHISELQAFIEIQSPEEGLHWWQKHGSFPPNAYSFSKQAIAVWTIEQAALLIKQGIRINCISPGSTQTPMLDEIENTMPDANVDSVTKPIGRRCTPEEQAWPLLMLNSEKASYINGVDLAVDGGAAALIASSSA